MANDKFINEIAGKLREHSSEVNPQLWQGISSQIGAGTAGVAGGLGFAKIAGIIAVAVTTVAITYFAVTSTKEETTKNNIQTADTSEVSKEVKTEGVSQTMENTVVNENTLKKSNAKGIVKTSPNPIQTPTNEREASKEEASIITPLAPEPILSIKKSSDQPVIFYSPEKVIDSGPSKTVENIEEKKNVEQQKIEEREITAKFINLPNIFTPNNDGVNDEFFVQTSGMKNYQLVVLDSKNNVVWSTNDPSAKWDGLNLGGEKTPNGSYLYFITAEDEAGNQIQEHKRLEIR